MLLPRQLLLRYYQLFAKLTKEAAEAVAFGNAFALYFEQWEVPSGDVPGRYARQSACYGTECLDPAAGEFVVGPSVLDDEGMPVQLLPGLIRYVPWLAGQVIRSNLDVARRIINPKLPISPSVIHVDAKRHTEVGRVTYANSITLTPGTISLDVSDETIEVHALTENAADDLASGEMARRVQRFEFEIADTEPKQVYWTHIFSFFTIDTCHSSVQNTQINLSLDEKIQVKEGLFSFRYLRCQN